MSIVFVVLGVGFLAGGAYAVAEGWPYLLIERGFTLVIIGTVLMTAGVVMLALSRVLAELARVRSQLGNAIMTLSLASMADPTGARDALPDRREPAGKAGLPDLGLPLGGVLAGGGAALVGAAILAGPAAGGQATAGTVSEGAATDRIEDQRERPQDEPDLFLGHDAPSHRDMLAEDRPAQDWLAEDVRAGDPLPQDSAARDTSDRQLEELQQRLQERLRGPQETLRDETFRDEPLLGLARDEAAPHASQATVPDPWTDADPPLPDAVRDEADSREPDRPERVRAVEADPFEAILAESLRERDLQPPSRIDEEFGRLRDSLAPLAAERERDRDRALDLAGDWMAAVRPGQERWSDEPASPDSYVPPSASRDPDPAAMAPWPPQTRDAAPFEPDSTAMPGDPPEAPDEPGDHDPVAGDPVGAEAAWARDDATAFAGPAGDAPEPEGLEAEVMPDEPEPELEAEPDVEPATAPDAEPAPPATSDEGIVGAYQVGTTHFTIFADGSINARTPEGDYSFASMDELKVYLASEKSRIGA